MPLERVAVIGTGAWGTALAQVAALAGRDVILVGRNPDVIGEINKRHRNSKVVEEQPLHPAIRADTACPPADLFVLAVPAQASRSALTALGADRFAGRPVVLSAKGLERGTLLRQSQVLAETASAAIPFVLSGPSFAIDVVAGHPTAVTLAGDDLEATDVVAAALAGPSFRPYTSDDRIGVELAGALKNVYALACGAVDGAQLGASARSALLARAYAEMARLVSALGGSSSTLTGLAGLGDLTLSCTSTQSRNYRYGVALGEGRALPAGELAEGVATAPVAQGLAQSFGIEAPLIDAVNRLLSGAAGISDIVSGLMTRPLKRED